LSSEICNSEGGEDMGR